MDTNIIIMWIVLFWIGSIEAIYMQSCKNKNFLLYTNFKRNNFVQKKQLKYLYINLYLCLSQ
mgnify:CR=1 FL=1